MKYLNSYVDLMLQNIGYILYYLLFKLFVCIMSIIKKI